MTRMDHGGQRRVQEAVRRWARGARGRDRGRGADPDPHSAARQADRRVHRRERQRRGDEVDGCRHTPRNAGLHVA